ncbi:hypothetical protein [Candidatus Desulfovibrio trichonymphae]|uniref:hypothetical protein n=1 Tax=Candidatus Desulfovibrio trichonymphae TaxID=1725232 RepID=UPI000BBB59DC|nr:hypothetical protein [Candidatus Desulfovibrio trichonymphae]
MGSAEGGTFQNRSSGVHFYRRRKSPILRQAKQYRKFRYSGALKNDVLRCKDQAIPFPLLFELQQNGTSEGGCRLQAAQRELEKWRSKLKQEKQFNRKMKLNQKVR